MTRSRPSLIHLCDWLPPDFGAVGQYTLQYARQRAQQGDNVTVYGLSSTAESASAEAIGPGRLNVVRLFAPTYDRSSLRERAWWTLRTNLMLVRRSWEDMRRAQT